MSPSAVPVTGHGPRVRRVGEQTAERDHELDLHRAHELEHRLAERAPAQLRLDAEQDRDVALEARERGVRDRVLRPVDAADEPVLEAHRRPRLLEVVELLGIDVAEALGARGSHAGRSRRASRPGRRRSSPEGAHEHRVAEDGAAVPYEMVHTRRVPRAPRANAHRRGCRYTFRRPPMGRRRLSSET